MNTAEKQNPVVPGVLLRQRNNRRHRLAPTFNPTKLVVMVTKVFNENRFQGVVLTGVTAGRIYEGDLADFRRVPEHVTIQVSQLSVEKRPGDIVACEDGTHVVVSSVDTIASSKLFAGIVIAPAGGTYMHQFSEHWHDDDFHIVRRREDLKDEAFGSSLGETFKAAVNRAQIGQKN